MTNHDDARLALGAYALGSLEPADQDLVEAHLVGCPACLSELAELERVVPVLAGLSRDDVAARQPSPDLFARITTAVDSAEASDSDDAPAAATDRPGDTAAGRRSRRWLVAVAASIVLLLGVGTAVGISLTHSSHAVTTAQASAHGVQLHVSATDAPHGTRLVLVAKGLRAHERCHLVAFAADGSHHPAGTWNASYVGHASVVESTSVPRSDLRSLTLYGENNTRLVAVNI